MTQNVVDFSDNPTGKQLMDDYLAKEQQNNLSSNSGNQRPSYAVAGTKWLDTSTTPWLWKMYDGTSDITLGTVDSSTHLFTPAGLTDVVDYTNITNCITKIPQDIKLELNDGTLTLKAGSKVYDGAGNVINVNSDLSTGYGVAVTGLFMVVPVNTRQNFFIKPQYVTSGDTPPTIPNNERQLWYDTTNKIVKMYVPNETDFVEVSLPVAIVTSSGTDSKFSSIDQVFNGFGYIGNTIFVLPGVEGLIPNGFVGENRNNTKFTTSSVLTSTRNNAYDDYDIILKQNEIANSLLTYDFENNKMLNYNGSVVAYAVVGKVSADSTGRITSFNPKTTFQAPDYQDVPKLATDNTFTGTNTFKRGAVFIKNVNIDRDVNPSATQYSSWLIQDKNGKQICNFYVSQNTTGTVTASMIATGRDGVDARISVSRDVNGTTRSYAPTPPTSDNSTQIATTAWVRSSVGVQTGTIIAFAGSSAPTGYLACNGAAVSRTTYSALFKVIGTRWGSGNGSTTFNLPNLNSGRFLRGNSSAGGYNNAGLPNITGSFQVKAGASVTDWAGSFFAGESIVADQMGGAGAMTNVTQFSAQRSSSIYGASSTVMPLSANVLFCIKY